MKRIQLTALVLATLKTSQEKKFWTVYAVDDLRILARNRQASAVDAIRGAAWTMLAWRFRAIIPE